MLLYKYVLWYVIIFKQNNIFIEDLRKLVLEKQQLDSEVLGLRAELQQLQTLSENQKSEIQSLQLLVSGMLLIELF